jgi:hypothetical protein
MPDDSELYGDSDDDALLLAATQHAESQAADDSVPSPRPAKRQWVVGPTDGTTSEADIPEDELLNNAAFLGEGQAEGGKSPNRRQHLLHAPRVVTDLDRVILTQTQVVPASQPWEIRGPVWKRPKPKTPDKKDTIAACFTKSQKLMGPPVAAPSQSLAQIIQQSNKETAEAEIVSLVEYVAISPPNV